MSSDIKSNIEKNNLKLESDEDIDNYLPFCEKYISKKHLKNVLHSPKTTKILKSVAA